jgi:beta-lactamase class D
MTTVKKIMVDPLVTNYVVRAKTGWGFDNGTNIGWYVGYLEIKKKSYYFVNCIKTSDSNNKVFVAARKEMVIMALKKLEIIPKK